MENRKITRLGREVSVVGLGCWQLGADWGEVDENDALAVLHAAADNGVTFFDTADVYGDGRSERLVGRFLAERGDVFVATKMGRRVEQLERVLPAAAEAGAGIIARVPLASGLLSGRYTAETKFAENDHRNYNRHGEAFDVGETFSGVPYEAGLEAVERLRGLVPAGQTLAQFALRWIIDQPGVSTVIPGARNASQASANTAAASLPPLSVSSSEALAGVRETYDELIRPLVHDRW